MKHILFDLEECPYDLLDDERFVRNSLFHASIASNSEILKIDFHKFYPQGVTGYALLADSHLSIHTWPERDYAALDIFMCGDTEPHKAIPVFKQAFETDKIETTEHLRGKTPSK